MDTRQVDAKAVQVWRWQAAMGSAAFIVPIGIVFIRAPLALAWALTLVYVGAATFCIWVLPRRHFQALRYGVDEHGITIDRGIVWRSRIALPRVRIQHSDVSQGPLQRRYGLATLKLYTAGSRYTKIELDGLAHADALRLRDALLARGGNSGV